MTMTGMTNCRPTAGAWDSLSHSCDLSKHLITRSRGKDVAKVSLNDLIAGKRVYIFGGHINWRNKMKSTYPALNIRDGHQTCFDVKMLLGADAVLLNTGNMSHKLYHKVIDVLRKNGIPFGYIGKYTNVGLLEQEIVGVLQK